jgi:hypothetical protein
MQRINMVYTYLRMWQSGRQSRRFYMNLFPIRLTFDRHPVGKTNCHPAHSKGTPYLCLFRDSMVSLGDRVSLFNSRLQIIHLVVTSFPNSKFQKLDRYSATSS